MLAGNDDRECRETILITSMFDSVEVPLFWHDVTVTRLCDIISLFTMLCISDNFTLMQQSSLHGESIYDKMLVSLRKKQDR